MFRGDVVFIGISLSFGLCSTLLVNFGETAAAGSGIPEVKGYLNGPLVGLSTGH